MSGLSETIRTWIEPIIALGAVGAVVDFYLGTPGQKRVKSWLEETWIRFHEIEWHNFSAAEARVFIRIVDSVFGRRFMSWKRAVSIVIVTALVLSLFAAMAVAHGYPFLRIVPWVFGDIARAWPPYQVSIDLITAVAAFALSISFTRWISVLCTDATRKWGLGPTAFGVLVTAHCALLFYWYPVIQSVTVCMELIYQLLTQNPTLPITNPSGAFSLLTFAISNVFAQSVNPLTELASYAKAIGLGNDKYVLLQHLTWATNLVLYLLANALRLVFALTLLLGFIGREWIGRLFSLTWARLVENEKPVFTIVFSALATFGSTFKEILSHTH